MRFVIAASAAAPCFSPPPPRTPKSASSSSPTMPTATASTAAWPSGAACGETVANSYCKSHEFAQALSFRKVDRDDITGAIPTSGPALQRRHLRRLRRHRVLALTLAANGEINSCGCHSPPTRRNAIAGRIEARHLRRLASHRSRRACLRRIRCAGDKFVDTFGAHGRATGVRKRSRQTGRRGDGRPGAAEARTIPAVPAHRRVEPRLPGASASMRGAIASACRNGGCW